MQRFWYGATVLNVVDGDTVDLMIDLGFSIHHKIRVRLYGVNTPESRTKDLAEKELGLKVQERSIDRTELYIADEMFFCGTGAQISPITSVDYHSIGSGEVGEITKKLQNIYFAVVKNQIPKYSEWSVPVF